ncbi:MAG: hypothetical protein KDC57_01095 [Saprospiraceae bacterium]|nr:hypothetical protein [Saprospiraceae bacterium]
MKSETNRDRPMFNKAAKSIHQLRKLSFQRGIIAITLALLLFNGCQQEDSSQADFTVLLNDVQLLNWMGTSPPATDSLHVLQAIYPEPVKFEIVGIDRINKVEFYVDGKVQSNYKLQNQEFHYTFSSPGLHTIKVCVDGICRINYVNYQDQTEQVATISEPINKDTDPSQDPNIIVRQGNETVAKNKEEKKTPSKVELQESTEPLDNDATRPSAPLETKVQEAVKIDDNPQHIAQDISAKPKDETINPKQAVNKELLDQLNIYVLPMYRTYLLRLKNIRDFIGNIEQDIYKKNMDFCINEYNNFLTDYNNIFDDIESKRDAIKQNIKNGSIDDVILNKYMQLDDQISKLSHIQLIKEEFEKKLQPLIWGNGNKWKFKDLREEATSAHIKFNDKIITLEKLFNDFEQEIKTF